MKLFNENSNGEKMMGIKKRESSIVFIKSEYHRGEIVIEKRNDLISKNALLFEGRKIP